MDMDFEKTGWHTERINSQPADDVTNFVFQSDAKFLNSPRSIRWGGGFEFLGKNNSVLFLVIGGKIHWMNRGLIRLKTQ